MFGDGALTFQEFIMGEPHPLAVIHDAVLEFLRGRMTTSSSRPAAFCLQRTTNNQPLRQVHHG